MTSNQAEWEVEATISGLVLSPRTVSRIISGTSEIDAISKWKTSLNRDGFTKVEFLSMDLI